MARPLEDTDMIPLGKYRGATMKWIMENDSGYLLWFLENGNPGNVKEYCARHEQEIRGAAAKQKKDGPRTGFKQTPTPTINFSTPEVTNVYCKMFKSAYGLLSPGAQIALKDWWKEQGVTIEGFNESDVQVKINQ